VLEIRVETDGKVLLIGRMDASQVDRAKSFLDRLQGPTTLDCAGLDYISSAGISVLLVTLKRLQDAGHSLRLVQVSDRVKNVFRYAGLDRIFSVE
jgi:anti-sigma B factor antagonist